MYAQVIHRLIDAIQHMDPNERAELHERVAEETAAAMNATPPEELPAATLTATAPPPAVPPAAA